MKTRLLITLSCLLILSSFTLSAIACECDPPCQSCESCEDSACVPYGDCEGGCPNCESCEDCYCECTSECCSASDCGNPACWDCVDCECECNEECCGNSDCNPCEKCTDCECECAEECCEDSDCGDPDCYDCNDCECEPFEIESVSSDKDEAPICVNIKFTATTKPSGHESEVSWSGGGFPATGSGATFTTRWNNSGTETVVASLCDSNDSKQVTIWCPTGENTTTWDPSWNGTLAQFKARLTPHDVDFSKIQVKEYVGGTGHDYCHFPGSYYPPWTQITGGTWSISATNWYTTPDCIGWWENRITYYRDQERAPCYMYMIQDMKPTCGVCGTYKQNRLEAHIGTTTLTSKRDGVSTQRNWP